MSKGMMNKKIAVFFEDIMFFHYFFVKFYLSRGYEVSVFDFKRDLKKYKWLRELITSGRVHRIEVQLYVKQHSAAIEATQDIYQYFKHNRLSKISADLYRSDDININFKKLLVEEIFKCICINHYLAESQNCLEGEKKQYLISANYWLYAKLIEQHSRFCIKPLNSFKVPLWHLLLTPIVQLCEKSKFYFASTVYVLVKSFFLSIGRLNNKEIRPQRFKYAMGINMLDLHGVLASERSASFLIDGENINKENTVFVVNCPLDREQSKFYKENRYKFIETKKINRPLELAKLNYGGIPVVNLVKAVFYMYKAWNLPAPFFNAFFINLRIFLDWSIVFRHISIENYIYSNRETAQQSAINILLSKHGGESWSHTFSLGGTYLLSRNSDFKDYRNMVWSFLFFDHFVGMNQDTVEYYKLHYQKVRKYYVVGCPYSEMICKKNIELKKKEFLEKVFNINTSNRMKVVTFFDTTFDDSKDALTNYDDCRSFYEDILKLLDARKDILVFIKPSKRLDFLASSSARRFFVTNAQEILRLYNILGSHPRVFYNKSASNEKNALDFRFNNTFIAASDLVITHCLSSPTAEALGARKKAIWYESGDKHRGMMYDRIPGLCAHGFDELITRVDELLYKTTDKEYDEYLDRYIRGKVESHLDGLALTRFRQLLIDKNRIGSYT